MASYAQVPYGASGAGISLAYGDSVPEGAVGLAYVRTQLPTVIDAIAFEDDLADANKYAGNSLSASVSTLTIKGGQLIDPSTGNLWVAPTDNPLFTTVATTFTDAAGVQATIPLFYCQTLRFGIPVASLPQSLQTALAQLPSAANFYSSLLPPGLDALVAITFGSGAALPAGYLYKVMPANFTAGDQTLYLSVYTNFRGSFRQPLRVSYAGRSETLNVHPAYFQSLSRPDALVYLARNVVDNSVGSLAKSNSLTAGASTATIASAPASSGSIVGRATPIANSSSPSITSASTTQSQTGSIASTTDNPYYVNGPAGFIVQNGAPTQYTTAANTVAPTSAATELTLNLTTVTCSSDANGTAMLSVTLLDPNNIPAKTWNKITAATIPALSYYDPNAIGGAYTWRITGTVDDTPGINNAVPAGQYNYTCTYAGSFAYFIPLSTAYTNNPGASTTYVTPANTAAPAGSGTQLSLNISNLSVPMDPNGATSYSVTLTAPNGNVVYTWGSITSAQNLTWSSGVAASGAYIWTVYATCTNTAQGTSTYTCNLTGTLGWYVSVPGAPALYNNVDGAVKSYQTTAATLAPISPNTQLSLALASVTAQSDTHGASSLKVSLVDPSGKVVQTWSGITAPETLTFSNLAAIGGQYTWKVWASCTNNGTAISTYNDTWTGTFGWYETDPAAQGNSKQGRPIGFTFGVGTPDGTLYATYDDGPQVYLQEPDRLSSRENWYMRLHRGWLSYTDTNSNTYLVGVAPYYKQNFNGVIPVISPDRQLVRVLDPSRAQLLNMPVLVDPNHPIDIIVTRAGVDTWLTRDNLQSSGNYVPESIADIDAASGIVTLATPQFFAGDTVHASYSYLEYSYVYRGFTDAYSRFVHLDVNPGGGHTWLNLWNIANHAQLLNMVDQDFPSITSYIQNVATSVIHSAAMTAPKNTRDASGLNQGSLTSGLTTSLLTDATYGKYLHVVGSPAASGTCTLLFGPYASDLSVGTYNVYFRARVSDNTLGSPAVAFDTNVTGGDGIYQNSVVKWADFRAANTWQQFSIQMVITPGYTDYETRCFWQGNPNGSASIDIVNVEIYAANASPPISSTTTLTSTTQTNTANVPFSGVASDSKTITTPSTTTTSPTATSQIVTDESVAAISAVPHTTLTPTAQEQSYTYTGTAQVTPSTTTTTNTQAESKTAAYNSQPAVSVSSTSTTSQTTQALASGSTSVAVHCSYKEKTGNLNAGETDTDLWYWSCTATAGAPAYWSVSVPVAPTSTATQITLNTGALNDGIGDTNIELLDPNGNVVATWPSITPNQNLTWYNAGAIAGTYKYKMYATKAAAMADDTNDSSGTYTTTMTPSFISLQTVTTPVYGATPGATLTIATDSNTVAPTTNGTQLALKITSPALPNDANGTCAFNVQLLSPTGATLIDQHNIVSAATITYLNTNAVAGVYTWKIWASVTGKQQSSETYTCTGNFEADWYDLVTTTTTTNTITPAASQTYSTGPSTLAPTASGSQIKIVLGSGVTSPIHTMIAGMAQQVMNVELYDPSDALVASWYSQPLSGTFTYSNANAISGSYSVKVWGSVTPGNFSQSELQISDTVKIDWMALLPQTTYTYAAQPGLTSLFNTDANTVAPAASGTQLSLHFTQIQTPSDTNGTSSFSVRLLAPNGTTVGAWDNITAAQTLTYFNAAASAGVYTWKVYSTVAASGAGTGTYDCTWTGTFGWTHNVTTTTYNVIGSTWGNIALPAATVAPSASGTQLSFNIQQITLPSDAHASTILVVQLKDPTGTALQTWGSITAATTLTYSNATAVGGAYSWWWSFETQTVTGPGSYACSFNGTASWFQQVNSSATVYVETDGAGASFYSSQPQNIATNADTMTGWPNGNMTLSTGGPGGAADAEQTGTGSAGGTVSCSYNMLITPGLPYIGSFWVDQSNTTSGATNGLIAFGDITGFGSFGAQNYIHWGATAQRYFSFPQVMPTNLCPEPYSSWTRTGSATASTQAASDGATYQCLSFTANTDTATSPLIPVNPGQAISLSAQIVGAITAGSVVITAIDQNGASIPGLSLSQTANSNSRKAQSGFIIPSGVTGMKLVANANGATFTGTVNVQTIMLTALMTDPGGYISTSSPYVQLYYELVSPVIASGQKLKVSQPMMHIGSTPWPTYLSPSASGTLVAPTNASTQLSLALSNVVTPSNANGASSFTVQLLNSSGIVKTWTGVTTAQTLTWSSVNAGTGPYTWNIYATSTNNNSGTATLVATCNATASWTQTDQVPTTFYTNNAGQSHSYTTSAYTVAPVDASTQFSLSFSDLIVPDDRYGTTSLTITLLDPHGTQVKQWTNVKTGGTLTYSNANALSGAYTFVFQPQVANKGTGTASYTVQWSAKLAYYAAIDDDVPTVELLEKALYMYLTVDGYPFHAALDPLDDPTQPTTYDTNHAMTGTRYDGSVPTIHAF